MKMTISSIELFSGAGGLALGLHQAGFEHRALLERDEDSCGTVSANTLRDFLGIQKWRVVQTDVRLVNYSDYGSGIQVVSGGPPCQPFSLGGKHKAHNDARDMFPEAVRAVREIRPEVFIFENVKGLIRKSFSTYFNYILLQLTHPEIIMREGMDWTEHLRLLEQQHTSGIYSGLAYNVVFRLFNAADYGVPQTRQRVVIVGFRNDLDANWSFPEATRSREALLYSKFVDGSYWDEYEIAYKNRPEISKRERENIIRSFDGKERVERWRTVRDAIRGLPDPRAKNRRTFLNHEFRAGARPYAGHSGSVMDEPSKTIKAGAHGVPGGENMLVLDDGSLRYYTVRESARIQTFPDKYFFCGSWTESMRQIGNAVPVKLAAIIGESVANTLKRLNNNGYKGEPANCKAV
ncbi:MAG: DNA cytosine methyltransferase [Synergistaceae bacterium]|jgi:DNA (cytosine-5)-methyltransferase 1|nr:DNA cytosine methyltransferase [Synergistaceae bacterium]